MYCSKKSIWSVLALMVVALLVTTALCTTGDSSAVTGGDVKDSGGDKCAEWSLDGTVLNIKATDSSKTPSSGGYDGLTSDLVDTVTEVYVSGFTADVTSGLPKDLPSTAVVYYKGSVTYTSGSGTSTIGTWTFNSGSLIITAYSAWTSTSPTGIANIGSYVQNNVQYCYVIGFDSTTQANITSLVQRDVKAGLSVEFLYGDVFCSDSGEQVKIGTWEVNTPGKLEITSTGDKYDKVPDYISNMGTYRSQVTTIYFEGFINDVSTFYSGEFPDRDVYYTGEITNRGDTGYGKGVWTYYANADVKELHVDALTFGMKMINWDCDYYVASWLSYYYSPDTGNHYSDSMYFHRYYFVADIEEMYITNYQNVGRYATWGCSGLTYIESDSVIKLDDQWSFRISDNSHSHSDGNYKEDDCHISEVNFTNNDTVGSGDRNSSPLACMLSLTKVTMPKVNIVKCQAFYNCTSLISVRIADSDVTIESEAFRCCPLTSDINLSGAVSIGNGAFYSSGITGDLSLLYLTTLGTINTPSSYTVNDYYDTGSGTGAFGDCKNITSVKFNVLTYVGDSSFYNCAGSTTGLTSVDFGDSAPTQIGANAFRNCAYLKSTSLPSSVTVLYSGAFRNCTALSGEIHILDNVVTIRCYAFSECTNISALTFGTNSHLTQIGRYAFNQCTSLTNVNESGTITQLKFPDSTVYLGERVFRYCALNSIDFNKVQTIGPYLMEGSGDYLKTVKFSTSITSIGAYAFNGCKVMEGTLEYSDNIKLLDDGAFLECYKLTGNIKFSSSMTIIHYRVFENCRALTGSVVIPASVTTIESRAFMYCYHLGDMPAGQDPGTLTFETGSVLESIGQYAFYQCYDLSGSLVLPSTVTTISSEAFRECHSFTGDLVIPSGVTRLEYATFYYCYGFDGSLTLPNNLEYIGTNVFDNCRALTGSITIPSKMTEINRNAFNNCNKLNGTLTLPSGLTTIYEYAFYNCQFTGTLTIPSGVTLIGVYAFGNCDGFTGTLTLPSSLVTIQNNAFYDCDGFTGNLIIPTNVVTIGNAAFQSVEYITGITINSTELTTIGNWAFGYCYAAASEIVIPSKVTSIGEYAFYDDRLLTKLTIQSEVLREIKYSAFMNCFAMTGDVTIKNASGDTLTVYGRAFWECRSIDEIHIGRTVKFDDTNVFYNCYGLGAITVESGNADCQAVNGMLLLSGGTVLAAYACKSSVTSIEIPLSVTSIKGYSFHYANNLVEVTFKGTPTMEDNAFNTLSSLKKLTLPLSVYLRNKIMYLSSLEEIDFYGTMSDRVAYSTDQWYYPWSQTSKYTLKIVFTSGTDGIYSNMFYDRDYIYSVEMADSVTTIGENAFRECSTIDKMSIGDGVTTIGAGAFYNCAKLTTLKIGNNVDTIGDDAFSKCEKISTLTMPINKKITSLAVMTNMQNLTLTPGIDGASGQKAGYGVDWTGSSTPWSTSKGFNLTLEEGVISIGKDSKLKATGDNLELPSTLQYIYENAFAGCLATGVTFNEGLLLIDTNAFSSSNCQNVTFLGNSVQFTGDPFTGSGAMKSLTAPIDLDVSGLFKSSKGFTSFNFTKGTNGIGITYTTDSVKNMPWYGLVTTQYTVSFAEGITSIGAYMFYGCSSMDSNVLHGLTGSIEMPSNLTIGTSAFQGCLGLTNLIFGENLVSVGDDAFNGCNHLESLVMYGSISGGRTTHYGAHAFANCTGLSSLEFPVYVDVIGSTDSPIFEGCTGLSALIITGSGACKDYDSNDLYKYTPWYYSKSGSRLDLTLSADITSIGKSMFRDCAALTAPDDGDDDGVLTFSNKVTTISDYAFYGCSKLQNVSFGSGVTYIGEYSFANCSTLSDDFEFPASITNGTVGEGAFSGCTGIHVVTVTFLPLSLGGWVFKGCTGITTLYYPLDFNAAYSGPDNDKPMFDGCTGLRTVHLTYGKSTIGYSYTDSEGAINNYMNTPWYISRSSTIELDLADEMTSVGSYTFKDSGIGYSVSFPANISTINAHAFDGCTKITALVFQNQITSIGDYAFNDCSGVASSLTFLSNFGQAGASAFAGCSSIPSITISDVSSTFGKSAFKGCTGMMTLSIPMTFDTVGNDESNPLFEGCNGLTRVIFTGSDQASFSYTSDNYNKTPWYYSGLNNKVINVDFGNIATIGDYTFKGCLGLKGTLVLGDGVKSIGTGAFSGCTGVTAVQFSSSVSYTFGKYAFEGAGIRGTFSLPETTKLDDYSFKDCKSISTLVISREPVTVGKGVFSGCGNLESLTVPLNMNVVVDKSNPLFKGCLKLNSVTFTGTGDCMSYTEEGSTDCYMMTPWYLSTSDSLAVTFPSAGMNNIGEYLFCGCKVLSGSVKIPLGVEVIGEHAFDGCSGIGSLSISTTSLREVGDYAFNGCAGIKSALNFPDTLKTIGEQAFHGCILLTGLSFEDGLVTIGAQAFDNCGRISSTVSNPLTIPSSVTSVGDYAFRSCASLGGLVISANSENVLGVGAFDGCSALKSLTIPIAVNTVRSYANPVFLGCSVETVVLTGPGSGFVYSSEQGGSSYEKTPWYINNGGSVALTISSGITSIGDYMFCGCTSLKSMVDIPVSVTSIGSHAFDGCTYMDGNLVLTSKVTTGNYTVGSYAFSNCTKIRSVTLSGEGIELSAGCFAGCSELLTLTMPISLNAVANDAVPAFQGCVKLATIVLNGTDSACDYEPTAGNGLWCEKTPWSISTSASVSLDGVRSVGAYTFKSCSNLSLGQGLPSNLLSIGEHAFDGCSNVSGSITIPRTLTYLGANAFKGCSNITAVTFSSVPTTLGESAFSGCSGITSLVLPIDLNVVVNNKAVFEGCNAVTSIEFTAAIISVDYTSTYNKTPWYFSSQNNYTVSVTFDDGVQSIGAYMFYMCHGLTRGLSTVSISSTVGSIGESAFEGCSYITSFTADGVTTVGNAVLKSCVTLDHASFKALPSVSAHMFDGCTQLTKVTLNEEATTIGAYAFYGDTSLTSVNSEENKVVLTSVTKVDAYAFAGTGVVYVEIGNAGAILTVGDCLFQDCSKIEIVKLNSTLQTLPSNTFTPSNPTASYRSTLRELYANKVVTFNADLSNYFTSLQTVEIQGISGNISGTFQNCTALTSVKLNTASDTYTLPAYCFSGCTLVSEIDLCKANLKNGHEFAGCTALTSANLTSSSAIPAFCFSGCTKLTEASAPIATSISASAFEGTGLITIDGSAFAKVSSVYGGAFKDCQSLVSIELAKASYIEACCFEGCISLSAINFPELTEVKDKLFYGCYNLSSVSLEKVDKIDALAFYGCRSLKTISLPVVTTIGDRTSASSEYDAASKSVFCGTGLTTVNMPLISTIGSFAFFECDSLTKFNSDTSIDLSVVDYIGDYAFAYTGVVDVTVGATPTSADSSITSLGNYAFYGCSDLVSFYSPSLTSLPVTLFNTGDISTSTLMRSLDSIDVPNVKSFNADMHGITSLTSVNAPKATTFASSAFYGCTQLSKVVLMDDSNAGAKVTLSSFLFYGCSSLKTINLTNVTFAGQSAFYGCVGLTKISMPVATKVPEKTFSGCTGLELVEMPKVTEVGANAFDGCGSLVTVTAPALTTVGDYAFNSCGNMAAFNSSTGYNPFAYVKTIGMWAFAGCPFTSVTFGPWLSSLGSYAFANNASLKEVVISDSLRTVPSYAFYGCPLADITIASSVTTIMTHAFDYTGSAVPSSASVWFNGASDIAISSSAFYSGTPMNFSIHASTDRITVIEYQIEHTGIIGGSYTYDAQGEIIGRISIQTDDGTPTYGFTNPLFAIYGGKIVVPFCETSKGGSVYKVSYSTTDSVTKGVVLLAVYKTGTEEYEEINVAQSADAIPVYPLTTNDPILFQMRSTGESFNPTMTIVTESFGVPAEPSTQTLHYGDQVEVPQFTSSLTTVSTIIVVRADGSEYQLDASTKFFYAGYNFTEIQVSSKDAKVTVTFVRTDINGDTSKDVSVDVQMTLQSLFEVPADIKWMETPDDGYAFDGWYSGRNGTGVKANAATRITAGTWYTYFTPVKYTVTISAVTKNNTLDYSVEQTVTGPYKLQSLDGCLYYTDVKHSSSVLILDTDDIEGYIFDVFYDRTNQKNITDDYGPLTSDLTVSMSMHTKTYSLTMRFVDAESGSELKDYVFTITGFALDPTRTEYYSGDEINDIDYTAIRDGVIVPTPLNSNCAMISMSANGTDVTQVASRYVLTVKYFDSDNHTVLQFTMKSGLYRVMFDIDDDAKTVLDYGSQVQVGDTIFLISFQDYTKLGYQFSYMIADGCETHFDQMEKMTITQEMADYAVEHETNCVIYVHGVWTSDYFTVSFDVLPYTVTYDPITIQIGDNILLPNVSGYTGHVINGWDWTSGSSTASIKTNTKLTQDIVRDHADGSSIILYAVWGNKTYDLVVDPDSGVKYPDKEVVYGQSFTTWDIGTYTQAYKKFLGWGVGDRVYASLEVVQLDDYIAAIGDKSDEDTVIFYFVWEDNEYQVQYSLNGGLGKTPVDYGYYIVNKSYITLASDDGTFSRSGYKFAGWTYALDSYDVYTGKVLFNENFADAANQSTSVVTMYAVWDQLSYSLQYELAGGSYGTDAPSSATYGEDVNISNPTRTGWEFKGWEATNLTDGALYKSSVGFSRWNGSANTATVFRNLNNQEGTVVLTATWSRAVFMVSYDLNGGDGTVSGGISKIQVGQTIPSTMTLEDAYKLGYDFGGWSLDGINPVDGQTLTNSMVAGLTGNKLVFYAVWDPILYTLDYRYSDEYEYTELELYYGESASIPNTVRTGYTFGGWTADGLGSDAYYSTDNSTWYRWSNGSVSVKATYFKSLCDEDGDVVKLNAVWTKIEYRIVYNTNGGTGKAPVDPNVYEIGDSVELASVESLIGTYGSKTPLGWSTSTEGNVVSFTTITSSLLSVADATNAINLYCIWQDGQCTVIVNLDGATPSSIPSGWIKNTDGTYQKSFAEGTMISVVLAEWDGVTLTKDGCTFDSWNYSSATVQTDTKITPLFENVNFNILYIFIAAIGIVALIAVAGRFKKY